MSNITAELNEAFQDFVKVYNDRLDRIEARSNRQGLTPSNSTTPEEKEHTKAFNNFLKSGRDSDLMRVQNALSVGSDPDGGYLVPEELDKTIGQLEKNAVVMRQLANVIPVSTADYKKIVSKRGATSGWVGETDARTETDSPALAELTPFWGELYAAPTVTQLLLEDAAFNVEAWLTGEISDEFISQEESTFITGNGVLKPKGILAYSTAATADATRPFGTLQHIITGEAASFIAASATVSPADCLINMVHSLKPVHRKNASWIMNSTTLGTVRKFKDAVNGNYIWQPSIAPGQPETLLGYPVFPCEDCPDVGAGALPVAFGDYKAGYTITDRVNWYLLRDPYTAKGKVIFYCRKRVGGMLVNSEAIKVLKVAAA